MAEYDRQDHYYKQAKLAGYRSRASYKLIEIDKKHKILKPNFKIVDLGAWPGGWIQVALKSVGKNGKVVGIDLAELEEFAESNVKCITGDVRDQENLDAALEFAQGQFDVVLSDMSPKLSGIKVADKYSTVAVAELALWASSILLKLGGTLVIKMFKGNETEEFIREMRKSFTKVAKAQLESTRKTSTEFYVIGFGYKGAI
jgi:23S rRNA (uridine2552-2'-O)-methyltransferase